ncbi:unnamed protein product [Sphacelaria rigidula]
MRRKQREAYEGHIKDNLRDLLLWEEQSWMTFVRSEDSAFNGTLKKIKSAARSWEHSYNADLSNRTAKSDERVKRAEGRNWYNIDQFESNEADRAWRHQRYILTDLMWDAPAVLQTKEAEDQRVGTALEQWGDKQSVATKHEDALGWLEAAGASAITPEVLSW